MSRQPHNILHTLTSSSQIQLQSLADDQLLVREGSKERPSFYELYSSRAEESSGHA